MQVLVVLIVDQVENIQLVELLIILYLAIFLKFSQVGLNDHLVELVQNFLLVLGVLAESKDQVLGGDTRCLRSCKEEGEHFVDNTIVSIFEVFIYQ